MTYSAVMAHSHCTGPEPRQGPGNDGFYITQFTVHITLGQGQAQGIIVFYCAQPVPGPCPGPGPVQCV